MATFTDPRHEMIRTAVIAHPGAVVATSIVLWQRLSVQLVSIIGDAGFESLFFRSLHLAKHQYPWLGPVDAAAPEAHRFVTLEQALASRSQQEATDASIFLLITLIDILTLLIGEQLMTSLLVSAWGNASASNEDRS